MTFATAVVPAHTLVFGGLARGLDTDTVTGLVRAVGLTKGVTTGDQRDGLRIVHGHPSERFTNVDGREGGVRFAVGSLWIDVNQTGLRFYVLVNSIKMNIILI